MKLISIITGLILSISLNAQSRRLIRDSDISIDSVWQEVEMWPRPQLNNYKTDTVTVVSITTKRGIRRRYIIRTIRKELKFDYIVINRQW